MFCCSNMLEGGRAAGHTSMHAFLTRDFLTLDLNRCALCVFCWSFRAVRPLSSRDGGRSLAVGHLTDLHFAFSNRAKFAAFFAARSFNSVKT